VRPQLTLATEDSVSSSGDIHGRQRPLDESGLESPEIRRDPRDQFDICPDRRIVVRPKCNRMST
jgi:hypothetical protein